MPSGRRRCQYAQERFTGDKRKCTGEAVPQQRHAVARKMRCEIPPLAAAKQVDAPVGAGADQPEWQAGQAQARYREVGGDQNGSIKALAPQRQQGWKWPGSQCSTIEPCAFDVTKVATDGCLGVGAR